MTKTELWVAKQGDSIIYIAKNHFLHVMNFPNDIYTYIRKSKNFTQSGPCNDIIISNPAKITLQSYSSNSLPDVPPENWQNFIFPYAVDADGYKMILTNLWCKWIKITKTISRKVCKPSPSPPIHGWVVKEKEQLYGQYKVTLKDIKEIEPQLPPIKEDLKDPRFWLYLAILVGALLFLRLL